MLYNCEYVFFFLQIHMCIDGLVTRDVAPVCLQWSCISFPWSHWIIGYQLDCWHISCCIIVNMFSFFCRYICVLMVWCTRDVAPVCWQWSCISFPWSHWIIGYELDCRQLLCYIIVLKWHSSGYFQNKIFLIAPIKSIQGMKIILLLLQGSWYLTHQPCMEMHIRIDEDWTPLYRTCNSLIMSNLPVLLWREVN